ncbi:hypothetical protein Ddye_023824 [Dipteronia dyeriana]|uniref:DUF1985 domain-containing protein n=1 Tax=Dipteronia dyeriana TaxID=168575 RepID=A0AAD9WT05_9ROSI|nr:hypothetical protein Ddye_023824 [Dipteronia dyeriana]
MAPTGPHVPSPLPARDARLGIGDGYRSPHPHPHFLDPFPILPIFPFGENGDGDVWGEMRNRLRDLLKTPEGDWYEGELTRHDHFDTLAHIDDELNWVPIEFADEDRRRFMTSCFEHFLMMHREMNFSGGNQSVRFSKVEFYLITGLRFGVVPDTTKYAAVENGIHQRYFPGADEVSLDEIKGVVIIVEFGEAYDVVKLCLIYMLNWILMGVDERYKIPVWQFRLVEDLDAFYAFPWETDVPYYIKKQLVRPLRWFLPSMLNDVGFHTARQGGHRQFLKKDKPFSISVVPTSTVP